MGLRIRTSRDGGTVGIFNDMTFWCKSTVMILGIMSWNKPNIQS